MTQGNALNHEMSQSTYTSATDRHEKLLHKLAARGAEWLIDASEKLLPYTAPGPSKPANGTSISDAGAPAPANTPMKNITAPSASDAAGTKIGPGEERRFERGDTKESKRPMDGEHPCDPSPRALDNGCGSGAISCALAQRFPELSIVAADAASDMLELVEKRGLENVRVVRCDTMNLRSILGQISESHESSSEGSADFRDGYSHVLSSFTHQLTSSPDQAVKEMIRALRPGGVLGLGSWVKIDLAEALLAAGQNLTSGWTPPSVLPTDWPTDTDELKARLEGRGDGQMGLVDVRVETIKLTNDMKSSEEALAYLFEGGNPILESVIKNWIGESGDEAKRELRTETGRLLDSGKWGAPGEWRHEMVMAVGRKD